MRWGLATAWVTVVCACTNGYEGFYVPPGASTAATSGPGGSGDAGGATNASGSGAVGPGGASSSGGGVGGVTGSGGGAGGRASSCGDGTLDSDEECDDGNLGNGDGCDGACVVECLGVKHPTTHHCYLVLPAEVDWDLGREACIALGNGWDLAALTTADEIEFADTAVPIIVDVWIGGNDQDTEGVFVWSDGEPWTDLGWNNGEPNNSGGDPGEDCVELDDQGVLNDTWCTSTRPVLCELTPAGEA